MKNKRFLIKVSLVSTIIVLTMRWIADYDTQRIPKRTYPPPTPSPTRTRLPTMRQSVTLKNGTDNFHLNLTSFEAEFPHLQNYNCMLLQEPEPEEPGATNQKLLILAVKSQPETGSRRTSLRKTWAQKRDVNGYRIRPLFLLGKTDVKGQMELAKHESRVYGDILQWDMTEGHHNLSLKERCFLEWLYLNSPEVYFIFKGDEDEFVNPEALIQYVTEHGSPDTVHGYHQHRPPVMRSTKYSITRTLYPQTHYPGFVSGGGFLFPGASVKSLYAASQRLPVFPLDDVYFGFLVLAANLKYHHDARFYVKGLKYDVCKYKEALVVHGVDSEITVRIWQELQDSECKEDQKTPSRDVRFMNGSFF